MSLIDPNVIHYLLSKTQMKIDTPAIAIAIAIAIALLFTNFRRFNYTIKFHLPHNIKITRQEIEVLTF